MRKRWNFHSGDGGEEQLINLTPLIDVVFVVLITFILVAPLLKLDRIQLAGVSNAQKKTSVSAQKVTPIAIRVYANDEIALNEERMSIAQLKIKLQGLKESFPQAIPELYQDKQATFGSYQNVKNTLEQVGYEELDLILKPE